MLLFLNRYEQYQRSSNQFEYKLMYKTIFEANSRNAHHHTLSKIQNSFRFIDVVF